MTELLKIDNWIKRLSLEEIIYYKKLYNTYWSDTMERNIVLMNADDWQGLYINGELVEEDHKIDLVDAFDRFDIDSFSSLETHCVNQEWIEDAGCFPDDIEDCILEEEERLICMDV